MTTLNASSNVTLTLSDYDSVTVSCLGPVLVEAVSGLGVTAGKISEFQGTRSFGPFLPGGQLKLTTYGRDAQYETANGVRITSPIVIAQSAVAVSVTGTLVETTLATITIPGNTIGPNGSLRVSPLFTYTNSANIKTVSVKFGGVTFFSTAPSTSAVTASMTTIRNRGTQSQLSYAPVATGAGIGSVAGSPASGSIDTTADQVITLTGLLTNTGETITLEGYTVEVLPG
jgi:hypothetical protein